MSNTKSKGKTIRPSKSLWERLADDAEQQSEAAKARSKELAEAARIFRRNAETGLPYPSTQN